MDASGRFVADAVLGIDTLWGGDVMCPSGTGRFIADSWFSDEQAQTSCPPGSAALLAGTWEEPQTCKKPGLRCPVSQPMTRMKAASAQEVTKTFEGFMR